jgi:hypothetical protein
MATPTAQQQRRPNRPMDTIADNEVPVATREERLGTMDRPRAMDEANADPIGTRNTVPPRPAGGFTTTFAIAAIVLLVAFLIALYLGSQGTDTTTSTGTTAPVTETVPAVPNNTTGSADTTGVTPAPGATDTTGTAPAPGTTGTGTTGTTTP